MDAIEMITERRSVRVFKPQKVDRITLNEIIELSRWAPSWANYQIARYTLVDDATILKRLADEGVNGFVYNARSLQNAPGVAVLSYVKGKSGKLEKGGYNNEYATDRKDVWELFDAGIACQTFCLAAHAKGVGTCIFGVINDEAIARIVNLPADESVAALIIFGYEEGPHAKPTPRKPVADIVRFI